MLKPIFWGLVFGATWAGINTIPDHVSYYRFDPAANAIVSNTVATPLLSKSRQSEAETKLVKVHGLTPPSAIVDVPSPAPKRGTATTGKENESPAIKLTSQAKDGQPARPAESLNRAVANAVPAAGFFVADATGIIPLPVRNLRPARLMPQPILVSKLRQSKPVSGAAQWTAVAIPANGYDTSTTRVATHQTALQNTVTPQASPKVKVARKKKINWRRRSALGASNIGRGKPKRVRSYRRKRHSNWRRRAFAVDR